MNTKKVKTEIFNIHRENKGRYGYRRITQVLKEKEGYTINHKTVLKLMKSLGLKRQTAEKNDKYHSYKGEVGKIADNL